MVISIDVDFLGNLFEFFECNIAGSIKSVTDFEWVESSIDETECLFKELSSEDYNSGGAVSNFVVLGLRELNEKFGGGVLDFHFFNDGGSVIGD